MKQQIRALTGALVLALVLAATFVSAAPQWAVTTTNSSVYLLDYGNPGTPTNATGPLLGSSLGGVAIWNDYVFVASSSGTAGSLHIGRIVTTGLIPTINWMPNTVTLSTPTGNVIKPASVAVDGTGGVYVINDPQSTTHGSFAYLPSNGATWASAGLNIFDVPTAYYADVATSGIGTQAIIAHQDESSTWAGQAWVAAVTSAGISSTKQPDANGYNPRGIAIGTDGQLSYMVNHLTDLTDTGAINEGSISVVDSSLTSTTVVSTGAFQPTDVSFFTRGGISYLGVVGTTNGRAQASRITLDALGLPSMGTMVSKTLDISNAFCTVSPDGSVFWITNPGTGSVTALDTLNWTSSVAFAVPGQPQYIAGYSPDLVPEPSSLAILLTGAIGVIGSIRRRRKQ